jgi:hypothetical protein
MRQIIEKFSESSRSLGKRVGHAGHARFEAPVVDKILRRRVFVHKKRELSADKRFWRSALVTTQSTPGDIWHAQEIVRLNIMMAIPD